MARLSNLLRPSSARAVSAASLATVITQTWGAMGNERVNSGTYLDIVSKGYSGNGVVFAVQNARAMLFSEAEPRVYDEVAGRIKTDPDPRLDLLREPWPNGSSAELLMRMEQDGGMAGNAYILKGAGRLHRLRPDWMELVVLPGEDGLPEVVAYLYTPGGGGSGEDTIAYGPEQIAHYSPVPDPLKNYMGMSWLTPVIREVNADIGATNLKIAFFENSATPNLLIKYAQKLSPETLSNLRARFEARHQGADQAFKTAVLDEGADLTVVGHSFEQIQLVAVQAAGENRISAAAGVPGIVVGLKEGLSAATYSNYEQAMRRLSDGTLRPLWRLGGAALGKFVDLGPNERLVLDATSVAALQQGEKDAAETFRIQATTAGELIRSGYDPDTIAEAVALRDLSLLEHTGKTPTALYDPNAEPPAAQPAAKDSPLAQGPKGDGKSG